MAGARALYGRNSRPELDNQGFVPFGDRNYDHSRFQLYVETPPVLSRTGTFQSGQHISAPDSALDPRYTNRKWTQADQSRVDEEQKKKAMKDLVTSWQDRLQLISVITTFFAGMEAQMLGSVTPDPGEADSPSKIEQAAIIGLSSALVVHVFAAIVSFVAAFFLVRFRVHEATHEEVKVQQGGISPKSTHDDSNNGNGAPDVDPPIYSTDPHLEQVGPFRRHEPPILLLDHCHLISMLLSLFGFALAMLGVMCYIWARLPLSARVVATAFVGAGILMALAAVFSPMTFAPVNRAVQSPAMKSRELPEREKEKAQKDGKLPGPRG